MMPSKEKATPPKSDRPENSVLLSLKELRRLEDERVQAEADAERRAKAEAAQRIRDEETRRAREEQERRQRAERELEARQREDRHRVEEAERRARVDGELELREQQWLEKQRQRHLQVRRFGRSPWMAAAAGATLILTVGAGLAAWASRQHQAEKQALAREIASRSEETRAAQLAFDARIRALEEEARRYLGEAKTAQDQARVPGDVQRPIQATEAARPRPPHRTAAPMQRTAARPPSPFRVPQKPDVSDTPLGGLPDTKSGDF